MIRAIIRLILLWITLLGEHIMNRILIVDNHAEIRRLIRMTLVCAGYHAEVIEAANADTALALTLALRPDVIVTDVTMPGVFDGVELCRMLKADPETAGITVVIISGKCEAEYRRAGLAAGAGAYLVKPFLPMELIYALEDVGVVA